MRASRCFGVTAFSVLAAAMSATPGRAQEPATPDTLAADTLAADTLPADTLPADTLPAGRPGVVVGQEVLVEVQRLHRGGEPLGALPFASQAIRGRDLTDASARSVTDPMQSLPGISAADQFGSPYQQEIHVRGFTASPVVGVPQGLSVFVDGVRVNEPDASEVNFNLIPSIALEDLTLLRGPKGPYGKNTLAGALVLRTKRGTEKAFADLDVRGGYFGATEAVDEFEAQGEAGGRIGRVDLYAGGQYLRSDGWRQLNAAEQVHAFAKLGYQHAGTDAWISYTFANDSIEAPGSLPESWLDGGPLPEDLEDFDDDRRKLQYTGGRGDFFLPELNFVNGTLDQELGKGVRFTLNGFGRFARFSMFNDNITEPNSLSETDIDTYGSTAQLAYEPSSRLALAAGAEYARNNVDIQIFALPSPNFPDQEEEIEEDVGTKEDNAGGFLSAWWGATPLVSLYGSMRYDYIKIPFDDRREPENNGTNTFNQVTGSTGFNLQASEAVELFASYGRGFRAPTILEITCSDEDDPCPLPFELGADPPIDPVKTDTWQAGLRARSASGFFAELTAYWAEVYDDIFFVTNAEGIRGFFQNIDRTRRQGLEAAARMEATPGLTLDAAIAFTRATFQSEARLATGLLDLDDDDDEGGEDDDEGGGDTDGDDGEAEAQLVEPGDKFPITPGVTFHVGLDYRASGWQLGLGGDYVSSQFLVSDETNSEDFGKLDPYFLVNANVSRQFGTAELYLRAENLFDAEFETFGLIARNVRGPDVGEPEAFFTPGEPFRLFGGIRLQVQ